MAAAGKFEHLEFLLSLTREYGFTGFNLYVDGTEDMVVGGEGVVGEGAEDVGEEGDEVALENRYPPRMNWMLNWMLTVKYVWRVVKDVLVVSCFLVGLADNQWELVIESWPVGLVHLTSYETSHYHVLRNKHCVLVKLLCQTL